MAGSSPVIRSKRNGHGNEKFSCPYFCKNKIRCHGQVVRHRSATPLSPVQIRVAPPKEKPTLVVGFSFGNAGLALNRSHICDGSNLKAKRKRLSIVFATLYTAKQGVCQAECRRRRQTTMRPVSRGTSKNLLGRSSGRFLLFHSSLFTFH